MKVFAISADFVIFLVGLFLYRPNRRYRPNREERSFFTPCVFFYKSVKSDREHSTGRVVMSRAAQTMRLDELYRIGKKKKQ